MEFHSKKEDVTWEQSTIREWLNGEFYKNAFTKEEKLLILETTVVNADNSVYSTDGGNDTVDRIFLLSEGEVEEFYFLANNFNFMWLRTPGISQSSVCVCRREELDRKGALACEKGGAVVPAMWIEIR